MKQLYSRCRPRRATALSVVLIAAATGPVEVAGQSSVSDVVEEVTPAVVSIRTNAGAGSGFIVRDDGVIFTNYHVVEGATAAAVTLASGEIYENVRVVSDDVRRDLAILKIPGYRLPTVRLGDSDAVRIGAAVTTIGHPLGLQNTVTTGVLSGRRSMNGFLWLQISAPVSHGSSGGPLLDSGGRAVGIIVAGMREGQNLNFAVPINYARGLLADADTTTAHQLSRLSTGRFRHHREEDPFTGEVTEFVLLVAAESPAGREAAQVAWHCIDSRVSVGLSHGLGTARTVRWKVDDHSPSQPKRWTWVGDDFLFAPPDGSLGLTLQALEGERLLVRVEGAGGRTSDWSFVVGGLRQALENLSCGQQQGETRDAWWTRMTADHERIEALAAERGAVETKGGVQQAVTAAERVTQGQVVRVSTCKLGTLVALRQSPDGPLSGNRVPRSDVCYGQAPRTVVAESRMVGEIRWFRVRVESTPVVTGWVPAFVVRPVP